MKLTAGQKVQALTSLKLSVIPGLKQNQECDIGIFCLSQQKLFGDDYFVFYNNLSTPCNSIKMTQQCFAVFDINLTTLDPLIDKVVVTMVAADGLKIKDMNATKLSLDGQEQSFEYETDQTVYQEHTAIMLFEFYKHNGVWKMCANGQGFNGGLAALIRHFGGDVEDTPNTLVTPPTPVKPAKISLEKVFEKEKPRLVNLAKQADQVILTKGLNDVVARVIIVLDASGSMHGQYIGGDVQRTIERIVPLAVKFDDNATLECYAFADKCKQLTDVTLANIDDYLINEGLRNYGGDIGIGGSNNEERVIKQIMEDTKGSKLPIFVVFICDGGVGNDRGIEQAIRDSCSQPIFWQFVGIGGSSYGVLKKLDDMKGRPIDNANFFELRNLTQVTETKLYEMLLEEFPQYLKEAKKLGLY